MCLALLCSATVGYSADPPPMDSLSFTIANGACLPTTASVHAGRVAVTVMLSSSTPQSISLIMTGMDEKHLFEHTQSGTSEVWSTLITLPAGSYQLINSVGTSKCIVTVN